MIFRGLNRQPANHAIGCSHLCSVRAKNESDRMLCWSKTVQATKPPNRDLPPIRCLSLFYVIRNTVQCPDFFAREQKHVKNHAVCRLRVSRREWECVSSTSMHYPSRFACFETLCSSSVRSLSSAACLGRQKDKAPEPNRNKISALDTLLLGSVQNPKIRSLT